MLGFEFGYALDAPDTLVLWEAQFGDFANGAQVIIDQFIASSESKWQRDSGLVMLLPHGYEGQGPEHSSARLERFLQLCAEDNMQVCYPSTPAQYFHMLRRQMKRNFRKPLIVMTPKSLLRHKAAVSPLDELDPRPLPGGARRRRGRPGRVRRVLLCSGKVYYDLLEAAHARRRRTTWRSCASSSSTRSPRSCCSGRWARYRKAEEIVWVQEESQNMGGWSFMEPRLRALGYAAGVRRPRRQRQPGDRLARGPQARAGGAGRGGDPRRGAAPGPRRRSDAAAASRTRRGERPAARGTRRH